MNKLTTIFLFYLIILSCQSPDKSRYVVSDYNVDTVNIDTIFLDFRFGMSESEFVEHVKRLTSNKILNYESKRYYFPMTFDETGLSNANAYILNPEYHSGKMCEFKVRLEPTHELSNNTLIKMYLKLDLMDKYGASYTERKQFFGSRPDFTIQKGNLEVSVTEGLDFISLTYSDRRIIDIVKNNGEKETKRSLKQSVDAL